MTPSPQLRLITLIFGLIIIAPVSSLIVPQRAHGLPVVDVGNAATHILNSIENRISGEYGAISTEATSSFVFKELVLDGLAWKLAQDQVDKMTSSILGLVNGNVSGEPQFVGDLANHLRKLGDTQRDAYINLLTDVNSSFSFSPFASGIADALNETYDQSTSLGGLLARNRCTLYDETPPEDVDAFLDGDFTRGGWSQWFSLTTKPNNNPYLQYQESRNTLANVVSSSENARLSLLGFGNGFLPNCDGGDSDPCIKSDGTFANVQTPGIVIQAQLSKVLGANVDRIVNADEISETLLNAALGFVTDVLGGNGSGGVAAVGEVNSAYEFDSSGGFEAVINLLLDVAENIKTYETSWKTINTIASDASDNLNTLKDAFGRGYVITQGRVDAGPNNTPKSKNPNPSVHGSCTINLDTTFINDLPQATSVTVRDGSNGTDSASATLTKIIQPILNDYTDAQAEIDVSRSFGIDILSHMQIAPNKVFGVGIDTLPSAENLLQETHIDDIDIERRVISDVQKLISLPPQISAVTNMKSQAEPFGGANLRPPGEINNIFGGTLYDQADFINKSASTTIQLCCFTNGPDAVEPTPSLPYYYETIYYPDGTFAPVPADSKTNNHCGIYII